ncbi:substrate-binding domain-containing protein [Anatilimnocola floriformis]|uniref:substrate-binding domain-containing protein n=1 Tax=Anatilimnocola floriformis TaxID=2948575 RepID=UPI0020C1FACF|nr:substrate-binding domain-containing protein [Anatilimnocola floriformis]
MTDVPLTNRIKSFREARNWSQAELAERAGISRSGISAIESNRLTPSVDAALQLARVFECAVEELFGHFAEATPPEWAWPANHFPTRYWLGEVGGRTLAYPVEMPTAGQRLPDGVAQQPAPLDDKQEIAQRTLVIATCDPAAQFLVNLYERQSPFRLLILSRSSGESLALLAQGLVHAAGVHLSRVNESPGNAALVRDRLPAESWQLLRAAQWEEGLAVASDSAVRTLREATKSSLRWIGRLPGAGARRCQDELRGDSRLPQRTARDHRAVAEAIVNEWAEAGICLRLASEEAQLRFFSICEDQYDLCYSHRQAADPRIVALVKTIRSAEYRSLVNSLPGYRAADAGEVEVIRSGS